MTEQQTITEAFTELAPSYEETIDQELTQFWGMRYQALVEKMLAMAAVKPGEKVLDIATGTAVIPLTIKSILGSQDQIVGLDITPAMLAEGRRDIAASGSRPAIDLVCASAMSIPFENNTFQVVTCGLGTHHMNVSQLLSEAKRVLAGGGRLILSDVCATPFWRSFLGKILLWLVVWQYGLLNSGARAKAEIEAYGNVRTAQEWSRLLLDFGFVNVDIAEVRPRFPWYPGGLTITAEVAA